MISNHSRWSAPELAGKDLVATHPCSAPRPARISYRSFRKPTVLGIEMELKKAPVLWHLTKVRMSQNRSGFSSDSVIKLGLNFTHFFYAITPKFCEDFFVANCANDANGPPAITAMWQYSAAHSRHSRNSRQKNLRKNPRNPPLVVQNGQIHDEDLPSLQSMMS